MSEELDGWLVASHGIYPYRPHYDEGPLGDNWCYIDTKTLCIVHFRPQDGKGIPNKEATIVSGPFPTLKAAQAAYVLLFGGIGHGG